jgi:hypothetical protein
MLPRYAFSKPANFSDSNTNMDWQTLIAACIVIVTLTIFLVRLARPKQRGGCGHDCGCGKK